MGPREGPAVRALLTEQLRLVHVLHFSPLRCAWWQGPHLVLGVLAPEHDQGALPTRYVISRPWPPFAEEEIMELYAQLCPSQTVKITRDANRLRVAFTELPGGLQKPPGTPFT